MSASAGASASASARRIALALAIVALGVSAFWLQRSQIYLLSLCCVYMMATFGLNLTMGYAGQMSLGQAAFFGIGAYIAAILTTKLGISFWLVIPIAAIVCFVVGLALGFPALRVQHHYLAFATLGFNVLIYLIMRNEEELTGGTFGIANVPRPSILSVSFDSERAYFWLTLAALTIVATLLWLLLRSPWGRAFAALRDNPIRAESLGVNITAYTLLAFAVGAACAGIGGVFYASLVQFVEPGTFHFFTSLMMLLAVIVGGSGRFFGPVLGTIVVILLPEFLRSSSSPALQFMQKWYLVGFGVALVALMVWLPGGLLSLADRRAHKAPQP
ncbi:MAG: branched-chain amino acid ABC transporter permease [Betaproteobacteria bacterium]